MRSLIFFHLFLSPFLLQIAAGSNPLAAICSSPENFTINDSFSNSLTQLLFLLSNKAPTIGFDIGSVGSGDSRVNGLALCRGDITSEACKTCINRADTQLHRLCPYKKDAVIWFDDCLLKYSNKEFFGEIDGDHTVFVFSSRNVSKPLFFNRRLARLTNRLMMKAYISPLLFATGQIEIGRAGKLYGLAQCTKDLSGGDCKICLEKAISQIPSCCSGKRGGRVLRGSCNIRYEMYQFFDL